MSAPAFSEPFAAALLDPARPCPPGLTSWNDSAPAQRFAVYRNNVTVSLVDALAETFPVVEQLVGEPFFRAMAAEFVRRSPPRSPVLAWYGDGFSDFVAAFPPAAGVPYLADMARLEYARVMAFHAADAGPVETAEIAARIADPAGLPELGLRLHPSLQVLDSPFAVVSLWAAHQGEGGSSDLAAIDPSQPECALVVRCGLSVEVRASSPAVARFIAALLAGKSLGEALETAATNDGPFDPTAILGWLIGNQLITSIDTPVAVRRQP